MKQEQQQAAISLPKGGGAIKGIGETFQPNLFSGTGNFSVPIASSPGRNDFGPKLTLQYSSGSGNGAFGVGWQLSIPRITRKTEKGLPTYTDKDVFVMSGAEDLVPVVDDQGETLVLNDWADFRVTRYRPRTEGLFARIEQWYHLPTNRIHWRATTKENITSIYGKSDHARVVDPDHQNSYAHVYEWLLEETFDAKGNHMLYEYMQESPDLELDGLQERNRRYTQAYPRRILYGNTPDHLVVDKRVGHQRRATHHKDPLAYLNRHYVFELLFDYGDLPEIPIPGIDWKGMTESVIPSNWPVRQDPFSSFRSGFEIRTLRQCRRILMLHHLNEGELINAPLVKSTDFSYHTNPATQLSFLEKVTVQGYRKQDDSSYLSRDMPPVSFKYAEFTPEQQQYQNLEVDGNDFPPVGLNQPDTTLMDVFGDGLSDVVQATPAGMHFWQNLGNGHFDRRHPQHGAQPPVAFGQNNVSIGDMGGDGLADLVVDAPPMSGFYESTPDGSWRTFKRFKQMPSFDLADPNTRLVDLTGDGLSDVLITRDAHFLWYQSLGEAGYAEPLAITRRHDLDEFPDVYFNDPAHRVRLVDMTGDGLTDIVYVHDGRIDYWPNLGYGRFGKRLTMTDTPRIGYGYDTRRLFLADLDGSGTADLVYVENNRVRFWFNRSGNGWSYEYVIQGTPWIADNTAIQFADILGTGTTALVWSYDYGSVHGGNYKYLDFCGGVKPNLLIEMDNNMGATTRAQYAPSTKFYLQDRKKGKPWVTNLPFPVQVLEKTEVIDHISKTKLVTTYDYHHGYYDGREREFRGFGRVDQYDTEYFENFEQPGLHGEEATFDNAQRGYHVPPVLMKNWFHTGIYFDEHKTGANGQLFDKEDMLKAYQEEYYQGDHRAFTIGGNSVIEGTGQPLEAYRALRGSLLRSEVYALDNTDKAQHPYTVTESRYEVEELQAHHNNPHGVYLTINKESLRYHYERNPADPRISQTLTLAHDGYGNVTQSVSIGYPRRRPITAFNGDNGNPILGQDGQPVAPFPEQRETKVIYTFSDFINKDDEPGFYYSGVPYQTRVFEVHGLAWDWLPANELYTEPLKPIDKEYFITLNDADDYKPYEFPVTDNLAAPIKRLVDWKRSYFKADRHAEIMDDTDQQWSEPVVLSSEGGRSHAPMTVLSHDSNLWTFWMPEPAENTSVRYRIYQQDIGTWQTEQEIVLDIGNLLFVRPLVDKQGNIWLFCNVRVPESQYYYYDLHIVKFDWATQQWGNVEAFTTNTKNKHFSIPALDSNGDIWVFWSAARIESNSRWEKNIYYKKYSTASGWSEQATFDHDDNTINSWANAVVDQQGNLHILWSSYRNLIPEDLTADPLEWDLRHAIYDMSEGRMSSEKMVENSIGLYSVRPYLDSSGQISINASKYYIDEGAENYWQSTWSHSNKKWNPFTPLTNFVDEFWTRGNYIANDKQGNQWLFWYEDRHIRKEWHIYYQRFNQSNGQWENYNGRPLTAEMDISHDYFVSSVIADSQGIPWVYFYSPINNKYQVLCTRLETVDEEVMLPLGEIDSLALPFESYQACFTEKQLDEVYGDKLDRSVIDQEGGYVSEDDYWWIPSGRQAFDKRNFYQPMYGQDPFGNVSSIKLDDYALLPVRATDSLPLPKTNIIHSHNNYRVLQPYEVIDPNGNHSQVAFDALGLVVGSAIWGEDQEGNRVGDSLEGFVTDLENDVRERHLEDPLNRDNETDSNPRIILRQASTRLVYDLKRYMITGKANVVYTLARETHNSDEAGEPTKNQHSFMYSDGFGREYQSKIQAEPESVYDCDGSVLQANTDPRWVGTGTKVYNNKGKPVEEYEPFFSDNHMPGIKQQGVSPMMFYDPLERVVCTLHPNHTWEKVVFDPWQQTTWDVNDTIHTNYRYDPDAPRPPNEDFSPAEDKDVSYFFNKVDPERYTPSWYKLRINDHLRNHKWPTTTDNQPNKENTYRNAAEQRAAQLASQHAGTPSTAHLDTLGRPFLTVVDNGRTAKADDGASHDAFFKTRIKLDIEGNDLNITDPRDIVAFEHSFDIAGRKLYVNSEDAGEKWLFLSVDNQPVYSWDANGNRTHLEFDELRRPKQTKVKRPAPYNDEILTQVSIYGEELATIIEPNKPDQDNLRGQMYAVIDSSGLGVSTSYDFKGNLTAAKKLLAQEYTDVPDWSDIDFSESVPEIERALLPFLEDEIFYSFSRYDALNRVTESVAPDHTKVTPVDTTPLDGSIYKIHFNEANLLERVEVDIRSERNSDTPPGQNYRSFVNKINYNSKGQRNYIEYTNGVTTCYEYDPETFRLLKLITKRSDESLLQSLMYVYDPAGNITGIKDEAIKTIYHDQQIIEPISQYQYDPAYRLITATGREHKAMGGGHYRKSNAIKQSEFVPLQPSSDTQALQMYTEQFVYDPSGNLQQLSHHKGTSMNGDVLWRREQTYTGTSNRIMKSGADASDPTRRDAQSSINHDPNGNMTKLSHLENLRWDFNNRLVNVKLDQSGTEAYYQYDMVGQRTRKIVEKGRNRKDERIYLSGFEIYRSFINDRPRRVGQTLHIMDDKQRIALVETHISSRDERVLNVGIRYQLSNHLGSAVTEIDEEKEANIISYEEYYAYGGTSFIGGKSQAEVSLKRYRYSGKERDDETGLYYYGARYYVPWLGRWCSTDPIGKNDGLNVYLFVNCNPINVKDKLGLSGEKQPPLQAAISADHNRPQISNISLQIDKNNLFWMLQSDNSSKGANELKSVANLAGSPGRPTGINLSAAEELGEEAFEKASMSMLQGSFGDVNEVSTLWDWASKTLKGKPKSYAKSISNFYQALKDPGSIALRHPNKRAIQDAARLVRKALDKGGFEHVNGRFVLSERIVRWSGFSSPEQRPKSRSQSERIIRDGLKQLGGSKLAGESRSIRTLLLKNVGRSLSMGFMIAAPMLNLKAASESTGTTQMAYSVAVVSDVTGLAVYLSGAALAKSTSAVAGAKLMGIGLGFMEVSAFIGVTVMAVVGAHEVGLMYVNSRCALLAGVCGGGPRLY